jgi:ferredoxin-NADP reductase
MTEGTPAGRQQPVSWQTGVVTAVTVETYRAKTFTIDLPRWVPFRAGQHYDVRLTAPDGYQAQRSYSIASAPETTGFIDLTVEEIPDGEVSPYFHHVLEPGDSIELRGPIGGPFTWSAHDENAEDGGPLLLVGGGSGIVPLMSMIRHKLAAAPQVKAVLLYSARAPGDVIYQDALTVAGQDANLSVLYTLTRQQPAGWAGYSRRVDRPMVEELLAMLPAMPISYVCGPTPFVEAVADELVAAGAPADRVRTERFGPSGS